MSNKYKQTISKIKTDDEFKKILIEKMEEENLKQSSKGGFIMTLRKFVITIISIISTFLLGGGVYAALGGTIDGVPVVEWLGIKFSDNYEEYKEVVENQVIEKDGMRVEALSTVCDDGFLIFEFDVKLNEEQKMMAGEFGYLAFNEEVIKEAGNLMTEYGGSNYTIIIDGEEKWIRPGSAQTVKEIEPNSEYLVYQMYFLDEDDLNGKDEFTVNLNNVVLVVNDEVFEMNGNFEFNVSKSKAIENTTTIDGNNTTIEYKSMKKTVDEVKITPLQNIVKLTTVFEGISLDDITNLENENYVGLMNYYVRDQNYNQLSSFDIETKRYIKYEDGTEEEWEVGDIGTGENFENATMTLTEYIAIEESEDITELYIAMYERDDILETDNFVEEVFVDLKNQVVRTFELNEATPADLIMSDSEDEDMDTLSDSEDEDMDTFSNEMSYSDMQKNSYFSIDLPKKIEDNVIVAVSSITNDSEEIEDGISYTFHDTDEGDWLMKIDVDLQVYEVDPEYSISAVINENIDKEMYEELNKALETIKVK